MSGGDETKLGGNVADHSPGSDSGVSRRGALSRGGDASACKEREVETGHRPLPRSIGSPDVREVSGVGYRWELGSRAPISDGVGSETVSSPPGVRGRCLVGSSRQGLDAPIAAKRKGPCKNNLRSLDADPSRPAAAALVHPVPAALAHPCASLLVGPIQARILLPRALPIGRLDVHLCATYSCTDP